MKTEIGIRKIDKDNVEEKQIGLKLTILLTDSFFFSCFKKKNTTYNFSITKNDS